jgi:perosamine synthetase
MHMASPSLSPAFQVVQTLREMFPKGAGLHEPWFEGREWDYVKECLDTRWVSSVGKFVDRFERDLAQYTGAKRVIVVANGTVALEICLRLVGVRPGDEVLIPTLTFVATANAVAHCGAVPHLVDSEENSLGMDGIALERHLSTIAEIRGDECFNRVTGRRIRALVPMHTFGHPVDLDRICEIASRYRLELVEDAAESLGSFYKGRHTGTFGKVASLSFNGNKTITTGGGGAILTQDEALGAFAKHLTTTAKVPHPWEFVHDQIGYNYRMPNLNAALGCAQLERLQSFLERKRKLAQRYQQAFAAIPDATVVSEPANTKSNYWLNALLLDAKVADQRDIIQKELHQHALLARPSWKLMHHLTIYQDCPKAQTPVAESLERRLICMPSSVFLESSG